MLHTKFGVNRTNRLEVIQILVFLRWRWAAILDFRKYDFWTVMLVADPQAKPHIKFGVNRKNRSEVTIFLIFIYFKMAGGGEIPTYRSKVIDKIVFHWICIVSTEKLFFFGKFSGQNLGIDIFNPPYGTSFHQNTHFDVSFVQIGRIVQKLFKFP